MPALESHFNVMKGAEVVDQGGELLGRVERIYLDRETDWPRWIAVGGGILGGHTMLVPAAGASYEPGGPLVVDYPKQLVWDAPDVGDEGKPVTAQEEELERHYGLTAPRSEPGTEAETVRSEEEVDFVVRRRARERVRLVKHVVTEEVTRTIPLKREEVRLERVPAGEAADGTPDSAFGADETIEMVLHEEQVVIEKRVVPRERVRVTKETVREEREMVEPVRKERVEVVHEPSTPR